MNVFLILIFTLGVYFSSLLVGLISKRDIKSEISLVFSLGILLYYINEIDGQFSFYLIYFVLILIHFFLVRRLVAKRSTFLFWSCLLFPLIPLVAYLSLANTSLAFALVGLSYMAFRMSYFAVEINGGKVQSIRIVDYFSFLLFIPTFFIGPISPFQYYQSTINQKLPTDWEFLKTALSRIFVGAIKFYFISNIFNQYTFSKLWYDGYDHGFLDFAISCSAYYIYMYMNFSGFCDLAIGFSALIGIKVKENFDFPFVAKNLQDYWNRWHISLSEYMRDVLFTPFTKYWVKKAGAKRIQIISSVSIFCTFVVLGLWHGVYIGYLLFGIWHGLGLSIYLFWRSSKLKNVRLKGLIKHPIYNSLRWSATFLYVSFGFFFFENHDMQKLLHITRILLGDRIANLVSYFLTNPEDIFTVLWDMING